MSFLMTPVFRLAFHNEAKAESQRLIEDFMIAANVAAAQTLIGASRPCVFQVHDQPDPEKTDGVRDLASAVGTKLAKDRFYAHIISTRCWPMCAIQQMKKWSMRLYYEVRQKPFTALKILVTSDSHFAITHISHHPSEDMPT